MKTSFPQIIVALLALTFVLAACASDTGSQWTYAPVDGDGASETAPVQSAEPGASPEPEATDAPEATVAPEVTAAPEGSAPPVDGEPRVIELQADSALRFTDTSGQPVPEIAVTPGETVTFRIENTAGFAHNFWIGTDGELSVPAGTTEVGLADWTTGVEELTWTVPEDITDLKFACTVPGHYYTMQGIFTQAEGSAEPMEPAEATESAAPEEPAATAGTEASAAPAEATDSAAPGEPTEPASGEPRVIELEADPAIRFLQAGEQIREIPVTPGETVIFRIDNTSGFAHNFYIGADEELSVPSGTTDTGIPDWETGVQEMTWVVPEDVSGVRFACTVPGHYYTMQGDFVVSP